MPASPVGTADFCNVFHKETRMEKRILAVLIAAWVGARRAAAPPAPHRATPAPPTRSRRPSANRKPRFGGAFFGRMIRMSVNVDPAELEKFSQLAHRWWDPHGEFRPLHDINPLRLEWIDQRAALAGKDVLDVGCGGGILAEAMVTRGAR